MQRSTLDGLGPSTANSDPGHAVAAVAAEPPRSVQAAAEAAKQALNFDAGHLAVAAVAAEPPSNEWAGTSSSRGSKAGPQL